MRKHSKHSDSKQTVIIRSAVELFSVKGIDGVSVKEIGLRAGVSDAALYKHFPSKSALAQAAYTHYADHYTRTIDYCATLPIPYKECLDQLIQNLLSDIQDDPYGLLLLSQSHDCLHEIIRNRRLPLTALTEFIAQAVHNQHLPAQDPKLSATLFIGCFIRLPLLLKSGLLPGRLDERSSEIQQRIHGLLGLGL